MHDKLGDDARQVLELATSKARSMNHSNVTADHILLGLINGDQGVVPMVLGNLNVQPGEIETELRHDLEANSPETTIDKETVIQRSLDEARALHHPIVSPEHILLALLQDHETSAARVLLRRGLDQERVREQVVNLIGYGTVPYMPDHIGHPSSGRGVVNDQTIPEACPTCGKTRIVRIVWKPVRLCDDEMADVDAGTAIIAGKLKGSPPAWACVDCWPGWLEVHRQVIQDHEMELEKEQAKIAQDWDRDEQIRNAQNKLRPKLAELIEELLDR